LDVLYDKMLQDRGDVIAVINGERATVVLRVAAAVAADAVVHLVEAVEAVRLTEKQTSHSNVSYLAEASIYVK